MDNIEITSSYKFTEPENSFDRLAIEICFATVENMNASIQMLDYTS